jgi:hypothetical protein
MWSKWVLKKALVAEFYPGDHARQRAVPALAADLVGRLAEPVMAGVELLEAVLTEVEGHHLPLVLAIVPTDAKDFVTRQMLGQVISLEAERFLSA